MPRHAMIPLILLCTATASHAQAPTPDGVCARLSTQTGLKAQPDGTWRANMLGGVGAALFGGTTGATFKVEPVEGSTTEQALDKACAQQGAEIACRVSGPARITVGTKRGNAAAEVKAGETATVGMKGRYLTCSDRI